jgi:hypothetical protein
MQAPPNGKDSHLTNAFDEAISAACASDELAHRMVAFVFPLPFLAVNLEDTPAQMQAKARAQCVTSSLPAVAAGDFVAWLRKQGEKPSDHVAAWLEATAGGAHQQEERDFDAAFAETGTNGSPIQWRYWVEQMPVLNAAQASRLLAGLDPDLFADLGARPNRNDPSKLCKQAMAIERLAIAEGFDTGSPSAWLEWATKRGFSVHDGFKLAVEAMPVVPASQAASHAAACQPASADPKPKPRHRAQEEAILARIKEAGLNPMALPSVRKGTPGPKAQIRTALMNHELFRGETIFDKAWDRLRGSGEVADDHSPALG